MQKAFLLCLADFWFGNLSQNSEQNLKKINDFKTIIFETANNNT